MIDKHNKHLLSAVIVMLSLSSCAKFVDIPTPSSALTGESIFHSNKTAVAAVNGIYAKMSSSTVFVSGISSVSFTAGLLSDELFLYPGASGRIRNLFENNMTANENYQLWSSLYNYVQNINAILTGIYNSTGLDLRLKQQLEGECKFLRAFCYFYLVTLYGDSPLLLTPDWKTNTVAGRTPQNEVWNQIIRDLKESKELLSKNFIMSDGMTNYELASAERVRPTKWAACSLLARTYLYTQNWENSEIEASQVIDQSVIFNIEPSLDKVFLKNSVEAIWQLMPVVPGQNTRDAILFILISSGFNSQRPSYIPLSLYNQFAPNDLRKSTWIGSVNINGKRYYFPYKYKIRTPNSPVSEYQMIFRLSELYLIRAEARAKLGKLSVSLDDLNKVRSRAGLADTLINNESDLLKAIVHERRLELFTEWGHRWLDMKRLGLIDDIMKNVTPIKSNGKEWKSYQQLMPIYNLDISTNPNLAPNNPGY